MLQAAYDGRDTEDAVDVEHHGGEHRIACQRRIGRALQQHDQDHHLDGHCGKREDQRAIRLAETHRQNLGMMGNAERHADDRGEDHQQQTPQHDPTMFYSNMLERDAQPENDKGDGNRKFCFGIFHGRIQL